MQEIKGVFKDRWTPFSVRVGGQICNRDVMLYFCIRAVKSTVAREHV